VCANLRVYPQPKCGMEITKNDEKSRNDVNINFVRAARVDGFRERYT
jgi:hypothetical protein